MLKKLDLSSIEISAFTSYLENNNWICSVKYSENLDIWHRNEAEFDDYEILQPLKKDILGYEQRVFELLETLALFEKREKSYILEELKNYNFDIFKIRVIGNDLNQGQINLNDGVLLFEKVKTLVSAITHSAISKKEYFTNPLPAQLEDFFNSLKFGQTEHGSYIVNVFAPHSHIYNDQLTSFNNNITSNITENFSRSLEALSIAIAKFEKNPNYSYFKESINKGVSANLCESLVGISGHQNNHEVEITIKSKHLDIKSVHTFNKKNIENLKIAADYLKGNYFIKSYKIIGAIVSLRQQPEDTKGIIVIKFKFDGVIRNIKISLNTDEYQLAIYAHIKKLEVSISGDLSITGKQSRLLNQKDFSIPQLDELDFDK
jgi:hypothetical protein